VQELEPQEEPVVRRSARVVARLAARRLKTLVERARDLRLGRRGQLRDIEYEVEGRAAHRMDIGKDEFFQVELYHAYFSMAWSTDLPIVAALKRLTLPVPDPDGSAIVFDERSQEHIEQPARQLLEALIAGHQSYPFVRIELPHIVVTWEEHTPASGPTSRLPSARDSDARKGRAGIISDVFDPKYCVKLLEATATTSVATSSEELIRRASYVGTQVPHGDLLEPPTTEPA
jgi:hypothetical protein